MNRKLSFSRLLAALLASSVMVFPTGTPVFAQDATATPAAPTDSGTASAPLQGGVTDTSAVITGTNNIIDVSTLTNITDIHVTEGATAVFNFGSSGTLNLSGNFNNSGTVSIVSTNPTITNATISATNISNAANSSISTIIPTNFTGLTGLVSNLSLTLNALNTITNAGSITSAGNLSVLAGTSITNGAMAAITATAAIQPVMQAMGTLNITTPNLTNMGLIDSITSNINIASQVASNLSSTVAQNLNITNIGGTLQALNGSINIGDSRFTGTQNLSLLGGDVVSQTLNMYAGQGTANVDVRDLIGTVNISGLEAHVTSATDNLTIGNINLSGDPTFYNQSGNVTINGDLNFNESLAIVASENIFTGKNVSNVSITTNGGSILLVAGANFTPSSGSVSDTNGSGNSLTNVSITGGSATGGFIDLSGVTTLSSAGASGGNVTLVAYGGTGKDAGTITLPTSLTIESGGTGAGSNGNVTIIAGGETGNKSSIIMGGVNATGGSGGGGNIAIATANPAISGGSVNVLNGNITSGAFFIDLAQLKESSIATKALVGSGSVKVDSGNHIEIGGNIESGAGIDIYAHGGKLDIFDFNKLSAVNSINLTGFSDVTLNKTSNNVVNSVTISAGVLNGSPDLTKTLASNSFLSMGSINVTSLDGTVVSGRGVTMNANGGDVNLLAKQDIDVQSDNLINAYGGYVTLVAGSSISVDRDTCITSLARYTDASNTTFYGGGIAIFSEQTNFDPIAAIQTIQAQQPGIGPGNTTAFENKGNLFTRLHGGYIDVIDSGSNDASHMLIKDSSFLADGGVITIQNELGNNDRKTNNIQIQSCCMVAIAPGQTTTTDTTGTTTGTTDTTGTTTTDTTGTTTGTTDTTGPTTTDTTGTTTGTTDTTGPTTTDTTGEAGGITGTTGDDDIPLPPGTSGTTGISETPPTLERPPVEAPKGPTFTPPRFISQLPPTDLTRGPAIRLEPAAQCSPTMLAQKPQRENGQFWMLATDPGQPYAVPGDDEAVVLARAGTRFIANGSHELSIQLGSIVVAAGEASITVFTRNGSIQVPAFSTATIEQSRFGEVRVASLEGSAAKWSVAKHGEAAIIPVAYGKEVSIVDSTVAAAGSADYIAAGTAKAGPISGISVAEGLISDAASAERVTKLLQCRIGCMSKDMRKRFKSLSKSVAAISPKIGSSNVTYPNMSYRQAASSGNHLMPVAATSTGPISVPTSTLRMMPLVTGFAKCSSDTVAFDSTDGNIQLEKGSIMVAAKKQMTVTSAGKVLRLKPGTIAQISSNNGIVSVRTLCERASDGAVLETGTARVIARSGVEIISASSDDQVHTQLHATHIGRRRVTTHEKDGEAFSSAEFSIPGLILQDEVLRSMVHSSQPDERKATGEIIKMAAILSHVTRAKGAYLPLPTNSK